MPKSCVSVSLHMKLVFLYSFGRVRKMKALITLFLMFLSWVVGNCYVLGKYSSRGTSLFFLRGSIENFKRLFCKVLELPFLSFMYSGLFTLIIFNSLSLRLYKQHFWLASGICLFFCHGRMRQANMVTNVRPISL